MNEEMKKDKKTFKEWFEEHEEQIGKVVNGIFWFSLGSTVAIMPYWGKNVILNKRMNHVFDDVRKLGKIDSFTGIHSDGILPSELGELGKIMLECGAGEGAKFTHFIAIRKSDKQ